MDILNFDITTWIKSFRGRTLLYGSQDTALVAHIYVDIGSLFTQDVVDKTHFTRRYKVYAVIAMQTNTHTIIHLRASHTLDHLHSCKSFYRIQPSYQRLYAIR
jgi:phosphate starvation-inducible membrane PsiE